MSALPKSNPRRPFPALLLGCCCLLSLAALAYPLYVIRPFRYQGPRELALALAVLQIGPWLQMSLTAIAFLLTTWSWKTYRSPRARISLALLTLLVVLCCLASRVNIFERMFHPLPDAAFSPASESKLDGGEMVIAVNIRGAARAYPIRSISYHHVVNDVVAGVPIVATY